MAQLAQLQAQTDAMHQQIKIKAEIGFTRIKAGVDTRITLLDAAPKGVRRRSEDPAQACRARDGCGQRPRSARRRLATILSS
jgi:hypothetical protein